MGWTSMSCLLVLGIRRREIEKPAIVEELPD